MEEGRRVSVYVSQLGKTVTATATSATAFCQDTEQFRTTVKFVKEKKKKTKSRINNHDGGRWAFKAPEGWALCELDSVGSAYFAVRVDDQGQQTGETCHLCSAKMKKALRDKRLIPFHLGSTNDHVCLLPRLEGTQWRFLFGVQNDVGQTKWLLTVESFTLLSRPPTSKHKQLETPAVERLEVGLELDLEPSEQSSCSAAAPVRHAIQQRLAHKRRRPQTEVEEEEKSCLQSATPPSTAARLPGEAQEATADLSLFPGWFCAPLHQHENHEQPLPANLEQPVSATLFLDDDFDDLSSRKHQIASGLHTQIDPIQMCSAMKPLQLDLFCEAEKLLTTSQTKASTTLETQRGVDCGNDSINPNYSTPQIVPPAVRLRQEHATAVDTLPFSTFCIEPTASEQLALGSLDHASDPLSIDFLPSSSFHNLATFDSVVSTATPQDDVQGWLDFNDVDLTTTTDNVPRIVALLGGMDESLDDE
eukprot:m.253834 g.253834  ORF g.253834 m.253834 type:complete len:476 (-) comp15489_c0_seq1:1755-3182(-)